MVDKKNESSLTGSLEDYLETIFELVRDRKLARVKDIAEARGVKSGSVSPAMRRLADLGLIDYVEREYIDLTPAGEIEARRIYARHQLLNRFFNKILRMSSDAAEKDACAMEHILSDEGMDHLVRFFEFLQGCPEGDQLLVRFHKCFLVHEGEIECDIKCPLKEEDARVKGKLLVSLRDLRPGEQGRVCQIADFGELRHRLIEKGIMPDTLIEMERITSGDDRITIKIQGFKLSLSREEAEAIMIVAL